MWRGRCRRVMWRGRRGRGGRVRGAPVAAVPPAQPAGRVRIPARRRAAWQGPTRRCCRFGHKLILRPLRVLMVRHLRALIRLRMMCKPHIRVRRHVSTTVGGGWTWTSRAGHPDPDRKTVHDRSAAAGQTRPVQPAAGRVPGTGSILATAASLAVVERRSGCERHPCRPRRPRRPRRPGHPVAASRDAQSSQSSQPSQPPQSPVTPRGASVGLRPARASAGAAAASGPGWPAAACAGARPKDVRQKQAHPPGGHGHRLRRRGRRRRRVRPRPVPPG
jgi:hypothetical protein